jgi:hypothetical protein
MAETKVTPTETSTNQLGYVIQTTAVNTTSTTYIQLGSLTTAVTIPAGGRNVKITACVTVYNNTAGNGVNLALFSGTVAGTQLNATFYTSTSANAQNCITLIAVVPAPAAGSATYTVGYNASATTANINCSTTQPGLLLVEII